MTSQPSRPSPKNPVDMLQDQIVLLNHIYQAQQEQLLLLRSLNEQFAQLQEALRQSPKSMTRVKVEDINMRFDSMVIFLFKRTFALLLVGIVFGFIFFCIFMMVVATMPSFFQRF
jgi:hypothetical protein